MNAHDAVIDAILAAIKQSPALAGGNVAEEVDFDLLPQDTSAGISVELVRSLPSEVVLSGAVVDWATQVRISCAARSDGRTAAGRASRALHAQVYQRLMADPSLGGVVDNIGQPRLTSEAALIGSRLGVLHADYTFQHRSDGATLEQPTP
ncbi:MAG: hypothetical protein C0423_03245 [Methylibium sp.]|nr:hypothetical protein [Methylibium sp.]